MTGLVAAGLATVWSGTRPGYLWPGCWRWLRTLLDLDPEATDRGRETLLVTDHRLLKLLQVGAGL
jgi:hypothetical protein